MNLSKELFGYTKYNEPVSLYRFENSVSKGCYVEIIDYGCRVRSICVPDKNGIIRDVCLGYKTLSEYENDVAYFGAVVGRCTNLISNACFELNNELYQLDKNDGKNHIHGGEKGFSFCVFESRLENDKLVFTNKFPDMSDGYPGNLDVKITYEWNENNELHITYEAMSDRDTILNLTNHTYFNLNGNGTSSVLNHSLWIDSEQITQVDKTMIPTGKYLPVENTPFDFRVPKEIGRDINFNHPQLIYGGGYDHYFILKGKGYRKGAVLASEDTGIHMTCYTDQLGLQIYTSNILENCVGKYDESLGCRSGICLETQRHTNAINTPDFPSVILKANELFRSETTYIFDTLGEIKK